MFNFLINVEILLAKLPLQLHKDKQLQPTGAQHSPSPGEGFLLFPSAHPPLRDGGSDPKATAVASVLTPCRGAGCGSQASKSMRHPSEPATLHLSESYLLLMHLGK